MGRLFRVRKFIPSAFGVRLFWDLAFVSYWWCGSVVGKLFGVVEFTHLVAAWVLLWASCLGSPSQCSLALGRLFSVQRFPPTYEVGFVGMLFKITFCIKRSLHGLGLLFSVVELFKMLTLLSD